MTTDDDRPADLPPEKPARRSMRLARTSRGHYTASNVRGGSITIGTGEDSDFTSVELLLAAIAGCTAVDVDFITSRRAEPEHFTVDVVADKVADEQGNHLKDVHVTFTLRYPPGEGGDAAREMAPRAMQRSHDRLCTVGRTVMLPTDITTEIAPEPPVA